MVAIFRRLVEPAKTPPDSPFKWNDERPKRQQVIGGIRIAAKWLFGFLVFVIAGISTLYVLGFPDRPSRGILLLSWVAMLGSAVVALWTAHAWARVILIFFGPAVIKIIAILVIEDDTYFASHSMTRTDGWEALAYIVTVVLLTSRFVGKRPATTTIFDRIALTVFVWTLFVQATVTYSSSSPALIGCNGLVRSLVH